MLPEFTDSEVSVSGVDNLVYDDVLLDENFDDVLQRGSELQQLIVKAFETRTSGAFRVRG